MSHFVGRGADLPDRFPEWDAIAGQVLLWSVFVRQLPREVVTHERERRAQLWSLVETAEELFRFDQSTEQLRTYASERSPVTCELSLPGAFSTKHCVVAELATGELGKNRREIRFALCARGHLAVDYVSIDGPRLPLEIRPLSKMSATRNLVSVLIRRAIDLVDPLPAFVGSLPR